MKSKIFILTISCLALIIVLFSCKKKNTITDNNPPNKPSAFFFTTETNLIGDNITFKVTAIDPDEDSIAARFDWGDGDTSGWSNFVPSGDTMWGTHCYNSINTYNVRAQIKDSKETVTDWSEAISIEVQDSAWTLVWTCATPHAPWAPRQSFTSVVFDNKIWVLGGNTDSIYYSLNDVWFSTDGVNWTCATEAAQWLGRSSHTSVIFDNKIWVLGGVHIHFLNDVWYSTDGVNWTCATELAGWSIRTGHTSVVFDNKIWVLGGWNVNHGCNDVWCSPDGINWTCINERAQWGPRKEHTSVVFNNLMWVLGGGFYDDVWFSESGADWICTTDSTGWPIFLGHTSVVFDKKIWVFGGLAKHPTGGGPCDDVWFSSNGIEWFCEPDTAPWPKREYHASVVFDNKIWIIGGSDGGGGLNDVWYGEIVRGRR